MGHQHGLHQMTDMVLVGTASVLLMMIPCIPRMTSLSLSVHTLVTPYTLIGSGPLTATVILM